MAGWRRRLEQRRHSARVQARDALELWLLPALAALLPWWLGFRLLRALAHWRWLYRRPCEAALRAATAHGMVDDARAWLHEHRLMMLVDHTDLFLARTRSDRWLRRHVGVQGDWQVQGQAALLVTFHWAAGMWAHRHARASGLKPHMLWRDQARATMRRAAGCAATRRRGRARWRRRMGGQ